MNSPRKSSAKSRFDEDYYRRHYFDESTRVAGPEQFERLARFILAYLDHLDVEVSTVLELGAGVGRFKEAIVKIDPSLEYEGVETSEYACRAFGWTQGSVVDFVPEEPADLVVCQGVLQYVGDREIGRAIKNLGKVTETALYLEALTVEDWQENVTHELTDGACKIRPASFYRERLSRDFIACGGGLFVKKSAGVVLFELEKAH
jgi:trans-aconitate methyltransferase